MNYKKVMKKCINLAKKAEGKVSPNPLVGCIILDTENKILSEGFHEEYGQNHAERNALMKLDKKAAEGATLVVNLEPCSHFGKTPPCADLIIEKGIKKVIIGMRDVNPIVSGNGIKKLKSAGIEVIEGILEDECRELNEIFIKNMTEHKTFVALKTATTIDGKIATYKGSSKWITSEKARNEVKIIRNKYDAIVTTSSTIIADNPRMLHKTKIILDRELKTDFKNFEIYKTGKCFIFYDTKLKAPKNTKNLIFLPCKCKNNKLNIKEILDKIYELGIMSILVEAGGHINGSFLDFTDKIYQFIAPKVLGDNKGLSCFDFRTAKSIDETYRFTIQDIKLYEPDVLITYKNNSV